MFGGLIPDNDRKQQLRAIRTIQAIGTGLIQSLIALALFFAGGLALSHRHFAFIDWRLGRAHHPLSADPHGDQFAVTIPA